MGASALHKKLKAGGAVFGAKFTPEALAVATRELGLGWFVVECGRAKTQSALMNAVEHALDFPGHFGHNLDAMYDCLTDLASEQDKGMVILLQHWHDDDERQKADNRKFIQVFEDAIEFAHENGKAFSVIVG